MEAVIIAIFALAIVSTVFRALVLSRHAHRFLQHDIWLYDTGARIAWLIIGVVALVGLGLWPIPFETWCVLAFSWGVAFSVVWWVSPRLAKLF